MTRREFESYHLQVESNFKTLQERGLYRLSILFPSNPPNEEWHYNYVVSSRNTIGNWNLWNKYYEGSITLNLDDVIGTTHNEYETEIRENSLTWIEWLGRLKRFYSNAAQGTESILSSISEISDGMYVVGLNNKYFVVTNGNNRMVILKFLGVKYLDLDHISLYRDY